VSRIYQITPKASQELEDILRYLASVAGFDSSDRFLSHFNQKLTKIAAFPNLGKPRPEWGKTHRSMTISDYLIIYRVSDDRVEILRVLSGYRDLDNLFDED
jgi:toxin ParE1/3/4